MPSMRPPGPPNQSFCCGISRPRLTLPLTRSDGSALLLRSAASLAASPVSGAADRSPEEFTSTRWKPLDCSREGRPPLAAAFWPRPVWVPRPAFACCPRAGVPLAAGFAGAAGVGVAVAGAGAAETAAVFPGAVAGARCRRCRRGRWSGRGRGGRRDSAHRQELEIPFRCGRVEGDCRPRWRALAKPSISTSMVHGPSARSAKE